MIFLLELRGDKTMKKLLILTILLTGCATSYQPNTAFNKSGFKEIELTQNHIQIIFQGNDKTSTERASDLALLRASELMIAKGCNNFQVFNSANENIGSLVLPQTHKINAYSSAIENRIHGNTNDFSKIYAPKSTIEVGCTIGNASDAAGHIYASASINESIKQKYQIGEK